MHDVLIAPMDIVPATCRWLLTLADAGDAHQSTDLEPLVQELRRLTRDPGLRLLGIEEGSLVLCLESSWDAMLAIDDQLARGDLAQLCGRALKQIDPAFSPAFIARLSARKKGDPIIRSFARRYGPSFNKAVRQTLVRASWSKYGPDELLNEVWVAILNRAAHILASYDPQLGKPDAYFFQIARNKARDLLRAELRREYLRPKEDAGAEPKQGGAAAADSASPVFPEASKAGPAARAGYHKRYIKIDDRRLQELPAPSSGSALPIEEISRHELERLLATFKEACIQGNTPAEREMWPFFLDVYYEGLQTDELELKYQLKTQAVHKRCQRLREKLQRLWQEMQKP